MRVFSRLFNVIVLSALFATITACSSGGGGNTGSSSAPITIGSSAVSMTLSKTTLQFGDTATATATFTKTDGTPASGIPVTFATTLGTLSSTTGVTDANGTATVQLTAGATSGPGQLTASATVDGQLVTKTALFNVTLPALTLTNLRFTNNSSATISFGSSQGITVEVRDANGALYTAQPVAVAFSSTQAAQGKATISSPVTTVNGVASTTYTALTATGSDTITASIAGSSKNITLNVTPLNAGSISFVSASPTTIGLKGMGGIGETSTVTFKVLDTSGQPKANQPVNFSLNTTVGGLSLSTTTGSTAADGTVSTIVKSGIIATPVRVTASTTVNGNTVSTQSNQLVVSTGVPDEDGMSISLSNLNPEAWSIDGVTVNVTARLSDHFHNPVPDGTAVSFTTNGGSIQSSCVTTNGACTVTWTSQNPRPTNGINPGRAVILATAIGEMSFVDLNGNGLADPGEFTDIPEAFLDINENGVRDANEPFIDFNANGAFDAAHGEYIGILQGPAFQGDPKTLNIFKNSVLVMASSSAIITPSTNNILAPTTFTFTVSDINGNTMPSGTTVNVSSPFGVLSGTTSFTFPQNTSATPFTFQVHVGASSTPKAQSGLITITVTSPGGLVTTSYINISGNF